MGDPTQLPPIEIEVYDVQVQQDNAISLRLRFNDGTYLRLEFPPDSPFSHDLLGLIDRHANDMLKRVGQRGLRVTRFTAPDDEEDES